MVPCPDPLFCGGRDKKVLWISNIFLCSQIYNFWGLLITADERQRPANKARMGKWHVFASTLKQMALAGACCFFFHSCFVSRSLLFISSNQQSPKVLDLAAQKFYWKSTRPFFLHPHTKRKKSGLGRRLGTSYLIRTELAVADTIIEMAPHDHLPTDIQLHYQHLRVHTHTFILC